MTIAPFAGFILLAGDEITLLASAVGSGYAAPTCGIKFGVILVGLGSEARLQL